MPVIPGEDPLVQIFFLAILFIFSIFALEEVVTLVLLLQTNLLPSELSISCSAHQLLTTAFTLLLLDFTAAVQALYSIPPALARPASVSPVHL